MSYNIYLCQPFKHSIKLLLKRFPRIKEDVARALQELIASPMLGAVIRGSKGIRKLRVASSDLKRGKSGGFRLLYVIIPEQALLCPLLIYAKSDRADVTARELQKLLQSLAQELDL